MWKSLYATGFLCLVVTTGMAWGAQQAVSPPAAVERAVFERYCSGCHNSKVKAAGLDLTAVSTEDVAKNPVVWEKVVRKLTARYMPPAGLPRPDERTYDALVATLVKPLDASAAAQPNPGRTDTFRRLNRTEYQNSIRDLLGIDVDVAALLPSDESAHGFDNVTVGELSPTLLERYLSAVQKISRLAIGIPARSPGGDTFVLPADLSQEAHFDELPLGTRGGKVLRYTFPLDGDYDIQLRLTRDRNEQVEGLSEPDKVDLMLDGERIKLFTVTPPPRDKDHSLVDSDLKVRMPVKAGPHIVSVTFPKEPALVLQTQRQPYKANFNAARHPRIHPALYEITINGPFNPTGPGDTPSRRRIFVCHPSNRTDEDSCARQILMTLMRPAYRRPVTESDLVLPLKFFRDGRTGGGFDAGIEMALESILMSAEFIFRVERDPPTVAPGTPYPVSELELASRLSFFLWSSIPDDELLDAAIQRKLTHPDVLEQQVRRMLADPRSRALVDNFADQWLYLRNLSAANPDSRLFPDFDDNLRQSFKEETELFFESIMREDRNVLDLLTANYTFLNERLAKHYGIRHVYGNRFRRVTFDENTGRGGLLRQGSILTVTSYANRTSPVIRGKWVLANILGLPPPPPPPFVPALKEHADDSAAMSMRQRLAEHRANPACAGCHSLMDPIGFSLENYDAVGRWRVAEGAIPVDASGGLPDGSKFDGVAGLERALLNRPDVFVTTLTEKLLTYALGRGVEYYDAPAVRKIVEEARSKNFRFSALVLGVASSTPFQMRRSQ
jgi:hypothetical protein